MKLLHLSEIQIAACDVEFCIHFLPEIWQVSFPISQCIVAKILKKE
jgi:hypothetical protein